MNEKEVITSSVNNFANAITKIDNKVVFVEKALQNETLKIKIIKDYKNYQIANITKIIKPNKNRIKPVCKYYDKCGGCVFLHTTNDEELSIKENYIKELFKDYKVNNIIKTNEYNYRNKVILHVKNNKIGLYRKGTNELVKIDTCYLLKDQINDVIGILKTIDLKDLKEIMIRTNENKDIMIKTIGTIKNVDILKILKINNLKSLYQNDKLIYGDPYIIENINNIKYTIYPDAFFQVNKEGMIKLYDLNRKYAKKGNKLLDLYCGTGTIGIYLSDLYKDVFGIEINKDSIKNAELNKKLNNIKSINFICGDASNIKEKYDTIIVDPPRAGLSKKVIDKILEIKPEKIVYTSCNPNTLKRDIKLLECNYSVKEITPVNMFPKTEHIECVALLIHK